MGHLKRLLFCGQSESLRFFLASSSALWALMLLAPGDSFHRPTYYLMAQIANEETWAALHLLHSVAAFYVLTYGKENYLTFALDRILGAAVWTTSAVAMLLSVTPLPAAIAPHIVGAAASWWLLATRR